MGYTIHVTEIFIFLSILALFECKVCNVRRSYICGQNECQCRETRQHGRVCRHCDEWCERWEYIECIHGDCTNDGCKCHACFSGASCGNYRNVYFPQFDRQEYKAVVQPFSRGVLLGISATDFDDSECAERASEFCQCAYIIYRVLETSYTNGMFKINPDTGDLHFDVLEEGILEITVAAYNYDVDKYPDMVGYRVGYADVILYITNEPPNSTNTHLKEMERVPNIYNWRVKSFDGAETEKRKRMKRQATNIPENSTAVIRPKDGWEFVTNVSFTDTIVLSLTISLSGGSHNISAYVMSDVTSGGNPLFHFCDAGIDFVGSNLHSFSQNNITLGLDRKTNSHINDIIAISIEHVANDESDTSSPAANDIVITFTATVLNPTDIEYDTQTYSVSASVLENITESVSVTNFTTNITKLEKPGSSSVTPSFNGPNTIYPGGKAQWDMSLSMDSPIMNLTIEHYESGNDSVEVCNVQIISVGSSFMCYDESQIDISKGYKAELQDGSFRITIIQLINGDFKVENSDDHVVIRIYGTIPTNAEYGQNYTLTLYINNGTDYSNVSTTVTVDNSPVPQSSGTPSIDITASNTVIVQSRMHTVNVSVSTNVNETDSYSLKFYHSQPSSCRLKFCDVNLIRVGSNIMCGLTSFDILYRNTSSVGVNDEVSIDLGFISNIGLNSDPDGDKVEFSIDLCYLECESLEIGDSFDVIGTLYYGTLAVTDSISLTIDKVNVTLNQPPTMNIIQKNGQSHIYYGGQTLYEAQIEFQPYTAYTNVSIELRTGDVDRPSASICEVYVNDFVNDFDPSLKCLAIDDEPTYVANAFDGSLNEKAKLNIKTVFNQGSYSIFINITFVVVLHDSTLQEGDIVWTDVTLHYNTDVLEKQISSTYSSFSHGVQTFPAYNVSMNSTTENFRIGEASLFDVNILLPVDFISKLFIKAVAIDTEIKICRIYMSSYGANIPCMADHVLNQSKTEYPDDGYSSTQLDLHTLIQTEGNNSSSCLDVMLSYDTDGHLKTSVYDFEFTITNFLFIDRNITSSSANGRFNDKTAGMVNIRIAVAIRNGFSYGAQKYLFEVQIWDEFVGSPWTDIQGLYVDTNSAYETPAPEIASSLVPIPTEIAKGSTGVVILTIYLSTKSISNYALSITVTSGCASICNLGFVSRGENNPCVPEVQTAQRLSSDGNETYDSATLEIGEIVNIGDVGSPTVQESNKLNFEVAIKIPTTSTCGSFNLHTSLSYNNGAATVSDSFNIDVVEGSKPINNDTIYLTTVSSSGTPVTAAISEIVKWKVKLHLPETIDRYQLSITFPVSENEAHLTAVNSTVSYIGQNIACLSPEGVQTTLYSSVQNTQMTVINISFEEYLSNTGTYKRSQFRQPLFMDDVIEIEFTFQVTDHYANIDGSVQNFTVTAIHSDGRSASVTDGVMIAVDGNEQATLEFDAWAESFNFTDKKTGDIIKFFGKVELQNTSNAHASNVVFHYMIPQYSVMTTLINYTDIEPNITIMYNGILEIQYDLLTFSDRPTFEIAITIDQDAEFEPGSTNILTVIPADVSYMSLQRPDRLDTLLHYTDIKLVQFGFNAPECYSIIGLETDPINECQISSSSELSTYRAVDVRSGSLTGWSPLLRGLPFCAEEYVQLDFLSYMRVVGLSVLSAGDDNLNYITEFTLEYNTNGQLWKSVVDRTSTEPKLFNLSFNDATKLLNDAVFVELEADEVFVASKIRLIPKNTNNGQSCRPSVRFDVMGCQVQFNPNIGNCSTENPQVFPLRDREFIVDEILGNVYACILSEIGGDVTCSRSTDNGFTWEDIPDIGNILGVRNNGSCVTGISKDASSRMCSYDGGITWMSCTDDEFVQTANELDYIQSTSMPFSDFQNESPSTMFSTFGFTSNIGDYTGTMSGISIQETGSGSWNSVAQWGDSDWMNI